MRFDRPREGSAEPIREKQNQLVGRKVEKGNDDLSLTESLSYESQSGATCLQRQGCIRGRLRRLDGHNASSHAQCGR